MITPAIDTMPTHATDTDLSCIVNHTPVPKANQNVNNANDGTSAENIIFRTSNQVLISITAPLYTYQHWHHTFILSVFPE